jgi:hypothetical protein
MSSTEALVPAAILGTVTPIVTIFAALPIIEKRLGRVRDVEREVGLLPSLVRRFYVRPLVATKRLLSLITAFGFLLALLFFYRYLFPESPWHPWLEAIRLSGSELLIAWFLIALVIYWNLPSRAAAYAGKTFGRLDRDASWPALQEFIQYNDLAKPLLVNESNARAFADQLLRSLLAEGKPPLNRAQAPALPTGPDAESFRRKTGNALLIGCIIEGAHSASGFPKRDWGGFYDAIGELAAQSDRVSPAAISANVGSRTFWQELLSDLNTDLAKSGQPPVPNSPSLLADLSAAFDWLVKNYSGSISEIDPRGHHKNRLDDIYARTRQVPGLGSESMRTQFVKLAVIWSVFNDLPVDEFISPYSGRIAALLFDRGIIQPTEDIKMIRFDRPEEQTLYNAAVRSIVSRAIELIEPQRASHAVWLPKPSQETRGETFRWWVAYELDFRLWDYAKRLHDGEEIAELGALTRWKLEDKQITRIKK